MIDIRCNCKDDVDIRCNCKDKISQCIYNTIQQYTMTIYYADNTIVTYNNAIAKVL